jgi:hypothetical protein
MTKKEANIIKQLVRELLNVSCVNTMAEFRVLLKSSIEDFELFMDSMITENCDFNQEKMENN